VVLRCLSRGLRTDTSDDASRWLLVERCGSQLLDSPSLRTVSSLQPEGLAMIAGASVPYTSIALLQGAAH